MASVSEAGRGEKVCRKLGKDESMKATREQRRRGKRLA